MQYVCLGSEVMGAIESTEGLRVVPVASNRVKVIMQGRFWRSFPSRRGMMKGTVFWKESD